MSSDPRSIAWPILRLQRGGAAQPLVDTLACEQQLRIVVGGHELAIASVLPGQEREFVYGWLYAAAVIHEPADVRECAIDYARGVAFVELACAMPRLDYAAPPVVLGTACGNTPFTVSTQPLAPLPDGLRLSSRTILAAVQALAQDSNLFAMTGCVHAAALCRADGTRWLLAEDVGRHNAFDKLVGGALLDGKVDLAMCFAVCTGRLSSEIAVKAWRCGLSVLASRSSATSRAAEIAADARMTLIGFARGGRMNIYTNPERIEVAV